VQACRSTPSPRWDRSIDSHAIGRQLRELAGQRQVVGRDALSDAHVANVLTELVDADSGSALVQSPGRPNRIRGRFARHVARGRSPSQTLSMRSAAHGTLERRTRGQAKQHRVLNGHQDVDPGQEPSGPGS